MRDLLTNSLFFEREIPREADLFYTTGIHEHEKASMRSGVHKRL
jgi:hypothetical protein